jgi:hypothetical protein
VAAEKAEAERVAAEKAEAERVAAEKAEAERVAAEKAEAERVAAEKAEAERVAVETGGHMWDTDDDPWSWGEVRVQRWARGLSQLPQEVSSQFAMRLYEEEFRGAGLVALEKDDLRELGLSNMEHLQFVSAAISRLADQVSAADAKYACLVRSPALCNHLGTGSPERGDSTSGQTWSSNWVVSVGVLTMFLVWRHTHSNSSTSVSGKGGELERTCKSTKAKRPTQQKRAASPSASPPAPRARNNPEGKTRSK